MEEKKLAEIVDIEVIDRVALDSSKEVKFYGDERQGFSHNGYEGVTSDAVRKAIAAKEITSDNKGEKLELLVCNCKLDNGKDKNIVFLAMARKASLTL